MAFPGPPRDAGAAEASGARTAPAASADLEAALDLAPGGLAAGPLRARAPALPWPWWALAAALTVAAALYLLRGALVPFALGALLAYLVAPAVGLLERRARLPRGAAILLVYLGLGLLAAAAADLVLPDAVRELARLLFQLPAYAGAADRHLAAVRTGYARLPLPAAVRQAADGLVARLEAGAAAATRQALDGLVGLVGLGLSAILAPVLAYYLLADAGRLKEGFARLLPPGGRAPAMGCLAELDGVLSAWIRGQLLLAAAVGALAAAALAVLGVRYAVVLGLVAGLGELIPYFGPILGAVPALAVAAAGGGWVAVLEVAAAFLLIQQLESALLTPRLIGGSVLLHPLVVIAVLLGGERVGGLAGVILAVPAAAALRVLARHALRALTQARRPRSLT